LSSILRALKRIEKESPPQDESHPWPRPIDSKKAVKSKVKKRWLVNKLVSGLIILLVVLAVGWFAYSQRHLILAKLLPEKSAGNTRQATEPSGKQKVVHQAEIKTPPGKLNKATPGSTAAPDKQSAKAITQKRVAPSGIPRPIPGKAVPKNITRPLTAPKPTPIKKKTPLKSITKRRQPLQPTGSRQTPQRETTNQRSTRAPATAKSTGSGKSRSDTLSVITDSKLKLQAIAWSDDATRRMAVINNNIVREGETVDGFSITSIRRDDVIVNDGSSSWRLEFSLKQ
jgi:type II secretory pathway component PulC